MDSQALTDGVFIGRYVLVEYDDPPIPGYYNDGMFYVDEEHTKLIEGIVGKLYQDLHSVNTDSSFYVYSANNTYVTIAASGANSPFAQNYNQDVARYGRGYDSTVWMKTVDATTGRYRYVLVAELNTIVPNFHLVADPPSNTPIAPYFDGQTTNLDYYIHVPVQYGSRIAVNTDGNSDEKIFSRTALWSDDQQQYYVVDDLEPVNGDIFYNRAGFSKTTRTIVTSGHVHMGNNNLYNPNDIDSINFTMGRSGRKYEGTHGTGVTKDDIILWHIYLPSIGNTVAEVWDYMFTTSRKLQFLYENFENREAATIDTGSILGVSNTMRSYIGRIYELPVSTVVTNDYTEAEQQSQHHTSVRYLDDAENRTYFYPTYANVWSANANGDYYYDNVSGAYKVANKAALPAGTTYYVRNSKINNVPYVRYKKAYTRSLSGIVAGGEDAVFADDREENTMPNTVLGAIAYINRILGTGLHAQDSRDDRTVIGLMNRMRDIIANVDTQLVANRLAGVDSNGVFTYTNIVYPYAGTGDHQELLDSSGTWRLPVTYKLETLNLMNEQDNTKYFDAGYYGNSCLHAVLAADTLGEAIKKMQNEMADIQYVAQTVDSFTVSLTGGETALIENGATMTKATLSYSLNKGPRQSISITRTAPTSATLVNTTNIDPEYYVTNAADYAASKSGTVEDTNQISNRTDTTLTWSITVVDERGASATKTVNAYWANRYYYGIGADIADLTTINTKSKLDNLITGGNKLARNKAGLSLTMAPGASQYMYYMQPAAWNTPTFKIGGFEGGMDLLGTFEFTNASGYATNYKIWRSTKANLGSTTLVIS